MYSKELLPLSAKKVNRNKYWAAKTISIAQETTKADLIGVAYPIFVCHTTISIARQMLILPQICRWQTLESSTFKILLSLRS